MNRLEEYIRHNKSLFDEEPSAGHFERLQHRDAAWSLSEVEMRHVSTKALRWTVSIAASIAILITAGMLWRHAAKQNGVMIACENAIDMKVCYLNRMNVVAGQIEALISDFEPWDQQEVMNSVQYIMDAANSGFENEIPEELSDKQAKAILSDYYRQNLEGLEMIKSQLKIKN